jgi:hypothetical protein
LKPHSGTGISHGNGDDVKLRRLEGVAPSVGALHWPGRFLDPSLLKSKFDISTLRDRPSARGQITTNARMCERSDVATQSDGRMTARDALQKSRRLRRPAARRTCGQAFCCYGTGVHCMNHDI